MSAREFAPGSRIRVTPPPGSWMLRARDYSVLVHARGVVTSLVLLIAVIVTCGFSLAFGAAGLDPLSALAAVLGKGDASAVFVVRELRWPRIEAGLLVGAALGMSGCLMQTLARNRLATPDIIGIDNGATAFAVASVVAVSTSFAPPAMALTGAITATALAFGLSGGTGVRGYRFIVVGIGVGAMFGSGTSLMLARASIDLANAAYPWTVGSLNARAEEPVRILALGLAVCTPFALVIGHQLSIMRLPDAVATGLGIRVRLVRAGTLAVAVTCTALSVAVAGPIGLIALVAPEAARHLSGPRTVPVVSSAVAGALFILLADLAGRTVLNPIEIPVGIVTAVVGGPYLLWILLRDSSRRIP